MVGVLPSRTRFFDLGSQCKVKAFQPIAGIWKTDILCQIVCQLVTNKLGMNYEKRGRHECPAHFIIATEKVFRQQKDGGAKDEPDSKPRSFCNVSRRSKSSRASSLRPSQSRQMANQNEQ